MFPSNNNGSNNDPIVYIDHSFLHRHFSSETTKPDDHPLSFLHFPSPYYNQCELELEEYHDVFRNQDHHSNEYDDQFRHQETLMSTDNPVLNNMPDCRNITTNHHQHQKQQVLQQKRSASKTDRHSKINTANGLRDRRMRLSLDVARDFFGLQDMLGYDKPSRTVEWLLIKANTEINKLIKFKNQLSEMNDSFGFAVSKSPPSTSEAKVLSGTDKADIEGSFSKGKGSETEKKIRVRQRKTSFRPLARDLREKARKRAKARTANIMSSRRLLCNETTNSDPNKFSSWSNQDHNKNNPFLQADNMDCSIFNCLQNAGINQEHHLTATGESVLWQTMGGLQ